MKFALCNEVIRELSLAEQARFASALDYDGLEIAPFTLDENAPHDMNAQQIRDIRRKIEAEGLQVSGLHWLLVCPAGLSITDSDADVRRRTREVISGLIRLCAELGGGYLIHGSPQQRILMSDSSEAGRASALETLAFAAEEARKAGVEYLLEPLSSDQTQFVNTVAEAAAIAENIASPAFATMLDCCSGAKAETQALADVLKEYLGKDLIRHVHVNDPNLRGPGQGELDFLPIIEALVACRYEGWVGVEPFDYVPDGRAVAARSIGTMKALHDSALRSHVQ
ncbi:sugar phosphate isomerase/epimerase family protein [Granulosicoccus sp. 3-233]|uniref:sugar phosphate isomerase/epimerase family protein n=1 Tax=Granulosicoccus sp. 3-233 TaxID=3417969 RepID=UPI003D345087